MIPFSCAHCGLKLQVKDEFAGRSTACPTCKTPLVIPVPDLTLSMPATMQLSGLASNLARTGFEGGGVTLAAAATANGGSGRKSVGELLGQGAGQRYLVEGEIARGGMGAILRAVDCDIRREVAVKYLLDQADQGKKARFVEEAQITGQLEHPNIVPIHELGVDAQKRLFFSMKMVRGRSLAQVIHELKHHVPATATEYTLTRLLHILINVCHALAYAHSRGVVHRDLKPANIMVGDFGEVYVMDWGLAKILAASGGREPDPAADAAGSPPGGSHPPLASSVTSSREESADLTREGSVLGTPLYMPPEQARGEIDQIDARSDVYALGALLYELLTLEPPVEREGGFPAILERVTQGWIIAPEKRAVERARRGCVPPELSAVALKALSKEKKDRYQTVEELRRDVELYLEGRAVSAKQDTRWETFVKLVKRNKGASGGAAAAFYSAIRSRLSGGQQGFQEPMVFLSGKIIRAGTDRASRHGRTGRDSTTPASLPPG